MLILMVQFCVQLCVLILPLLLLLLLLLAQFTNANIETVYFGIDFGKETNLLRAVLGNLKDNQPLDKQPTKQSDSHSDKHSYSAILIKTYANAN